MTSIPPELEGKIIILQQYIDQANALEQARQIDEAQSAYMDCLDFASREYMSILGEQLVEIWMGIGFCHAGRNDWHPALEWYHRVEAAILSAPELNREPMSQASRLIVQKWTPFLPKHVRVSFRRSFPAKANLAKVYDSIALAYENSNQPEQAKKYFQLSNDLHSKSRDASK
jgi:tetratricopeptide (TPR) repeat protein